MKFRIILETKTKNNHDLVLKLNVPPSKHQGIVNFMKIALENNNDVVFKVEKESAAGEKEKSSVFGKFKFQKE